MGSLTISSNAISIGCASPQVFASGNERAFKVWPWPNASLCIPDAAKLSQFESRRLRVR